MFDLNIYHIKQRHLILSALIFENYKNMEAQSPSQQIEIHYPSVAVASLNDSFYKLRQKNDQLLLEIIRISNENQKLSTNLKRKRQQIPSFLINWWNSNQSLQKMSVFLQQLNSALQLEIDQANRKIYQCQSQCEVNEADYDEQIKERGELQKKVKQLSEMLEQLLKKKNASLQQCQYLLSQTNEQKMNQYSQVLPILRTMMNAKQDIQKRINVRFAQNDYQNKEEQYYAQFQQLISSLLQRKQTYRNKLAEIDHQIKHLDKCISAEQRDRETKHELKKSIMKKRRQIKALNDKAQTIKAQKQEIRVNKIQLQQKYSQQGMDKIVPKVNRLSKRSNELLLRVLELLKEAERKPNLQQNNRQFKEG